MTTLQNNLRQNTERKSGKIRNENEAKSGITGVVSVVVPNYNYGKYIRKRILSIVRQTYPIYELIILDDKSSDNSIEEIHKVMAEVNREYPKLKVRLVKNEMNSGKAILQWKKGFELAKGDYVWIAEADDLSAPGFLAEAMKGFKDSEVMISYTESKVINSLGIMMASNFRWSRDKEKTGHYDHDYIKKGEDEIREIMAIRCTIPNVSAVVFRKDPRILEYLSDAAQFTQVGDWYLYTKILEDGKITYNRKALNKFRVHTTSVTAKAKNSNQHLNEIKWMHDMLKEKYNLSGKIVEYMDAEYARVRERNV